MAQPASVIDLYDSLLAAEDERTRARIIAGAFERLEDRYPELRDLATASGVRQSELRLQKEIEQVRSDLTKQIEQVRSDLTKDIEQVRLRIEEVRADLTKEIHHGNQKNLRWTTGLMFAQLVTIIAVVIGVGLMQ